MTTNTTSDPRGDRKDPAFYAALSDRDAAIDVGSNSVRMLFQGAKTVEITALGEGLMHTGRLSVDAMRRTANAVFLLKTAAERRGCRSVSVFATEAVRAAKNRAEFIGILAAGGVTLDLLSPEREALTGFTGAYTCGTCAVADIGGASSELVVGNETGLLYSHSLPLGCVRLNDFSADTEEEIRYADARMEEYGDVPPFGDLIVIGGTSSTFVAVKERLAPYDPEVVQGYRLSSADVAEITALFCRTPVALRGNIPGLQPKKALTAVSSGVLLQALLHRLNRTECIVSERDNLEGYLILRRGVDKTSGF